MTFFIDLCVGFPCLLERDQSSKDHEAEAELRGSCLVQRRRQRSFGVEDRGGPGRAQQGVEVLDLRQVQPGRVRRLGHQHQLQQEVGGGSARTTVAQQLGECNNQT